MSQPRIAEALRASLLYLRSFSKFSFTRRVLNRRNDDRKRCFFFRNLSNTPCHFQWLVFADVLRRQLNSSSIIANERFMATGTGGP